MKNIFNTWEVSLNATFFIIIVSFLNIILNFSVIEYLSFFGTAIALLVILFNVIFLLIKREWRHAFVSFIILLITLALLAFYSFLLFWVYQSRPDKFADDLEIPLNIDINIPLDMMREVDRMKIEKNKQDFDLYGGLGTYKYDFWVSKIDSGTVYLKAFEVTKEYQLSSESFIKSSSIPVYNPIDSIVRFGTAKEFTIYEGDWDKPYAARFELWYKPTNGNSDKKLLEKVYKIEGWQR